METRLTRFLSMIGVVLESRSFCDSQMDLEDKVDDYSEILALLEAETSMPMIRYAYCGFLVEKCSELNKTTITLVERYYEYMQKKKKCMKVERNQNNLCVLSMNSF